MTPGPQGGTELPIIEWAVIEDRLAQGATQANGTGGPDRHTSWFETGELTRKGRNLASDPRCTLSVATDEFDLVVEGVAEKVVDPATVVTMAEQ